MLPLRTTDDFAEWFARLDDGAAEDVAATIEVVARLGSTAPAPGSSDGLTWYEHPEMARIGTLWVPGGELPSTAGGRASLLAQFVQNFGAFSGYVRRVVAHLESPAFVERVRRIGSHAAETVTDAVTRIRRVSTSRWLGAADLRRLQAVARGPAGPKDLEPFARFTDTAEIREAYFSALAAAGFEVVDLPDDSPALREIGLRTRAPGLRLLYGIDARRGRGLVVLGERLDRTFYGDSVRRAERLWLQFLDGDLRATQAARAR